MIDHLDHLVLTTNDEEACTAFYVGLLGMKLEVFGNGRKAFRFGDQKINLHIRGREFEPKADRPTPGALDLCFIADRPLDDAIAALATDAASFDALLSSPQLAIDGAKIKGATAKSTLSALNDFLRDDLRAGMELLKDTHEDAYKALREASQVDDARYGKGAGNKPTPPATDSPA